MEDRPVTIESESKLTFFEATSIIVGHGVGSGILAVPYIASRTSWFEIILIVALAYAINRLLAATVCWFFSS